MEQKISPKYKLVLIDKIKYSLRSEYSTDERVLAYISQWHEEEDYWENFPICYKDNAMKQIDLFPTLCKIPDDLILKIAIDLGLETPDYIPSIPTFRNDIKNHYKNASVIFEKAFHNVESDPSLAIGLANSALESIVKSLLRENKVTNYDDHDTLTVLVKKLIKHFKLNDASMPNEIKTISNSLLNVSKEIETLRSDKTAFHGKTTECEIITQPEYAYFVVNTTATIGLFLLKYRPIQNPATNQAPLDDLPF